MGDVGHWITKNLGLKLLSFMLAGVLWVAVFGSRTVEVSKEIPFEVVLNDRQILIEPVPEKVIFRLSGPKAFLRTLQNRPEDPIKANVSNIPGGVVTHRIFSDLLKLPLGVRVLSITPNAVPIKIEERVVKMVPVSLQLRGQLPGGLKVTRAEVLSPTVRVTGPKSRVDGFKYLSSLPIDLSLIDQTTVLPLSFDLKPFGVDIDGANPEALIEVQGKGQAYRIRHVPVKLRSNKKGLVADQEVTLIVRTDDPNPKIEGDQFAAEIDARDLPSGEHVRWIHVSVPENLKWVRSLPAQTKITIRD